jgi:uncharacterized protein (TIGR02246 family)
MQQSEFKLGSIGQIARAVDNLARAQAWYREVLGLPHLYTYGKLAFFDCGGTRLMLEDRSILEEAGLRNDSVLYFRVADIQAAHDALRRRGAVFTDAPHMIAKHPDGTEEWMAFFRDSEGGLLAIMAQVTPAGNRDLEQLLEAFADAWNRHDVEALMSMMTDDGVFEASAGDHVNGERHEGPRAVRAAFEAVFAQYPDAHWAQARHIVKGNRGVSEWTFTGTLSDGRRVEVAGCDLLTFRDGKIAVKNSFRKNRPPRG